MDYAVNLLNEGSYYFSIFIPDCSTHGRAFNFWLGHDRNNTEYEPLMEGYL